MSWFEEWIGKKAARNVWMRWRWQRKGNGFASCYYAVRTAAVGHNSSTQHYLEGMRIFRQQIGNHHE